MIDIKRLMGDVSVRLALAAVLLVAVVDLSLRVFPDTRVSSSSSGFKEEDLFLRLAPSPKWQSWFTETLEKRAQAVEARLEAERVAQEEAQAAEDASVLTRQRANAVSQPKGDVRVLRLGGLDYQLLGVFVNQSAESSGSDEMFAVLDSKQGGSMKIQVDEVIDSYKVSGFTSRSVIFDSVEDERVVTLWLFGKGPR